MAGGRGLIHDQRDEHADEHCPNRPSHNNSPKSESCVSRGRGRPGWKSYVNWVIWENQTSRDYCAASHPNIRPVWLNPLSPFFLAQVLAKLPYRTRGTPSRISGSSNRELR